MKKRGVVVVLWTVVELVIGAILFTSFIGLGTAWGKGEMVNKAIVAKDIALTIAMLQSSTDETYVKYDRDVSSYILRLTANCVEALSGIGDTYPAIYCFPPSVDIKETTLTKPNLLYIIKTDRTITISDKTPTKIGSDFCYLPQNIKFPENPTIFIDPLFENIDEKNKESLLRVTNALYTSLKQKFENTGISLIDMKSGKPEKFSPDRIKGDEKKSNLVIKLKISTKGEKSISISFDPAQEKESFDKMSFLACRSIKALSEIDVSERGDLSRLSADGLSTNKKTIIFDLSSAIFSGEESKARLLAHDIGSKIAGGIIDVYPKAE
jgi:hypothetical protein